MYQSVNWTNLLLPPTACCFLLVFLQRNSNATRKNIAGCNRSGRMYTEKFVLCRWKVRQETAMIFKFMSTCIAEM